VCVAPTLRWRSPNMGITMEKRLLDLVLLLHSLLRTACSAVLLASSSLVCLSKVFFYNSLFEQSFFFTTVCLSKVEYHKRNAGKLALGLGGWPSRPTTSTCIARFGLPATAPCFMMDHATTAREFFVARAGGDYCCSYLLKASRQRRPPPPPPSVHRSLCRACPAFTEQWGRRRGGK
jgi:hypothetical protein